MGGISATPPNSSFYPTIADVGAYDVSSNTWRIVSPMPVPLNHANSATVNGKIYVLGGLLNGTSWYATPRCFMYDPAIDTWIELPPMPNDQARGSSAMGVYNDKIYLAGGMRALILTPDGLQDSVATVTVYDPSCGNWTTLPDIPAPRDHVGGAVIGNKMYVVGGRDHGQLNVRNTTWALDLDAPESGWDQTLAEMPTARGGLGAGVVGDKIYTFGGEGDPNTPTQVYPQVEAYDTLHNVWTKLPDMPLPRHGTFAASIDNGIYIPGGGVTISAAATDHFDVFRP